MNFKIRQSLILLLAATIWGVAFVAQSEGMKNVGPLTFNGIRSILGGLVLIPVIAFISGKDKECKKEHRSIKHLVIGGVCCGIALCAASTLQQIAIQDTDVGKAGFITAMYIVIVPVISLVLRKKSPLWVYLSVLIAFCGFFVMCMDFSVKIKGFLPVITGDFSLGKSEVLLIISAFIFSLHILIIDYFSPKADGVKLSCIQFFVCGIINCIMMFIFENPHINNIWQAKIPILYAGILSCGVAYTLHIVGQKGINPTIASLILSLESVVSIIAGWLLLNEHLTGRELIGCIVIFAAIILAQIPSKKS